MARLQDQSAGKCVSLTAVYQGQLAGYVSVYITGLSGAFSGKGLPEIVDFGVLEKYQRKGIGGRLMDTAEEIAGKYADTVWLGVGLHSGYGSAQRIYVKRGYIPDGTGVWYQNKPCAQYETEIANDDNLVLFLNGKTKTNLTIPVCRPAFNPYTPEAALHSTQKKAPRSVHKFP